MMLSAALLVLASLPRVEQVALQAHDAGVFDGEVLVSSDGKLVHHQAVGLLNREAKTPHSKGTRWRWASVTKQVTAVLVLQELERHHLSLESTLGSVLPSFQGPTKDAVTIRMLLQHTSGLPNPNDTPPSSDGGQPSFYESAQAAAALGYCAGPASADSLGSRFSYNNCDYLVLAAVLEHLTGMPWPKLVAQRIAKPLGLTSLEVAGRSGVVGYLKNGAREPAFSLESYGAAGALTGTPADLVRFDEALRGGKLLTQKTLAMLWQGVPALGYEALGQWSYQATLKGCEGAVALIERRGEIGGVQVVNVIAPARKVDVVVFSNTEATSWGEVWQGRGLLNDLLTATLCETKL